MNNTLRRTVGDPAWPVYLVCCALVVLGYFATPANDATNPFRIVLYCGISASAVPALLYGIKRHRPRSALPWVLLAASQLVYALADTSFYTAHYLLHIETFPFVADLFYLGHYPLIVTGLLL